MLLACRKRLSKYRDNSVLLSGYNLNFSIFIILLIALRASYLCTGRVFVCACMCMRNGGRGQKAKYYSVVSIGSVHFFTSALDTHSV